MSADPAALRAADAAARLAAQRQFHRPLVLVAGAGTGKTAALVARIVCWCLGPGWDRLAAADSTGEEPSPEQVAPQVLEGVVAITFTEAAAAEMAHGVAKSLAAVEAGKPPKWLDLPGALPELPPDEAAARARRLLTHLDRLNASTIHAFCRRLLAAHPLEAGLHPAFTVDAQGEALDEALHEAVEESLRTAYAAPGDPHALALAAQGIGPPDLAEAARALLQAGLPPAALEADPFAGPALAGLVRRLADATGRLLAAVGEGFGRAARGNVKGALAVVDAARALAATLAAMREPGEGTLDLLVAASAALLDGTAGNKLENWAKGRLTGSEGDCLGPACAAVPPAAAELREAARFVARLQPRLFDHARRVLAPLARDVRRRLRERGAASFQDLLTGARDLLAGHPGVRAIERRKIHQLLVDEFQDTDRLQCEILRWLALDGPAGERPGLFLVGDPKQSIYGWRDADLAAYEAFVAAVVAGGGEERHLVVNFRSVPAILAEVERLIAPVMAPEPGVQPPFEPLLACEERRGEAGFTAGGRGPVEHWISWLPLDADPGGAATRAGAATELEARAVARDLRELHDAGALAWPEAALLLRAASDLEVYLRALQEAGIPYAVARDRSYFRRREVMEAAALVRAVLDPADHLALLTALRAAWVGVPDAALLPLWEGGLPELATELAGPDPERLGRVRSLAARVAATLGGEAYREIPGLAALAGWEESLAAFAETLGELRASFAIDPAHRFVEKLRTATLIEATEAARFLGPWRLANLDRFFRQLAATLDEGGDADALLRFLRRAVAESREAPEGRPREAAEQAVQVMTIHVAKGLDFRHVYAVELHKRTGAAPGDRPSAAREIDSNWELQLFGWPSPGWWRAEEREERVRAAEQIRLLYVAATRAKDRLVLAGKPPDRPKDEPAKADTFADLLPFRQGWPTDLEGRMARVAGGGARGPEDGGRSAAGDDEGGSAPVGDGLRTPPDDDGAHWVFPGLAPEPAAGPPPEAPAPALSAEEAKADATDLARRRDEAEERMSRPFRAAASEEAHHALAELFAARAEEGEDGAGGMRTGGGRKPGAAEQSEADQAARRVAMAVGTAVHRLLETIDLEAEPEAELAHRRQQADSFLASLLSGENLEAARHRQQALLDRFATGNLWQRLQTLQPHLLARELPILLPATPPPSPTPIEAAGLARPSDAPTSTPVEAAGLARPTDAPTPPPPVGLIAGAIDLLYRDPATRDLVVADYKTDDVTTDADLQARAAIYLRQGAVYRQALQQALDLPTPPRLELWFLAADRIWTAEDAAAPPTPPPPADQPPATPPSPDQPANTSPEPQPGDQLRLF
jgi:ATP-dependent exoDNAse (exonuclease V) beta subunit